MARYERVGLGRWKALATRRQCQDTELIIILHGSRETVCFFGAGHAAGSDIQMRAGAMEHVSEESYSGGKIHRGFLF